MGIRDIRTDWLVFAEEGHVGVGAVRRVMPDSLLVYIEGYTEIRLHEGDIASAHDGKVILDMEALEPDVREAIQHAHDRESRGAAD